MRWIDNRIELEEKKSPKKITGTRFATILGLNAWATPFAAWCEITRTYQEPFEDTIYMKAGRVIEPKICEYLRSTYFMNLKSPTDVYGADYFEKTRGDFFRDKAVFGGMWDFIGVEGYVVEVKTTKRVEDWADGIPMYYKLQAALYGYLLGYDKIVVTVSFLTEGDYITPDAFVPSVENTKIYEFRITEDFPNFKTDYIDPAMGFWYNHVLTGFSPAYDEKRDADILDALRTKTASVTNDKALKKLTAEADKLQAAIDKADARIAEKRARLKVIDDAVKKYAIGQFGEQDKRVKLDSKKYAWTFTRSDRTGLDTARLKKDLPDVYEKYQKSTTVYTLKKQQINEDK